MKKALLTMLVAAALSLSACGYHLVGHGDGSGAVAADVKTLSFAGSADARLISDLRRRLQSDTYTIVNNRDAVDNKHHAVLHVTVQPLRFTPSAYDVAGVATQYRMVFTGQLRVDREGVTTWQSGPIQRQGDVFVTGGPASIEASRQRLFKDLKKQWVIDAAGRIRSGF